MGGLGSARGRSAWGLRGPRVGPAQSCFYFGPSATVAQFESMLGSLSERNGLSCSLLRGRRGSRSSNFDLFGTGRCTDGGGRERGWS